MEVVEKARIEILVLMVEKQCIYWMYLVYLVGMTRTGRRAVMEERRHIHLHTDFPVFGSLDTRQSNCLEVVLVDR